MPGTSDAIAIITEDIQYDTLSPEKAYEMFREALKAGQESLDALSPKIKKMAKAYAEKELPDAEFTAY